MDPYANLQLVIRKMRNSEDLERAQERKRHLGYVTHMVVAVPQWASRHTMQTVANGFDLNQSVVARTNWQSENEN